VKDEGGPLGIGFQERVSKHSKLLTAFDVATAVTELATNPDRSKGIVFIVSGKGLEAVP
jgi:hypothetical protein